MTKQEKAHAKRIRRWMRPQGAFSYYSWLVCGGYLDPVPRLGGRKQVNT